MLKPKGILASLYQSKNFSFAAGYFVGRPMNHAEPAKEQQQGADEQRPAANAQIPGGTCNVASSIRSNFGHKRISFARCFAEPCFVFVLCNRFLTQKLSQFCLVGLLFFFFLLRFRFWGEKTTSSGVRQTRSSRRRNLSGRRRDRASWPNGTPICSLKIEQQLFRLY